MKTLSALVLAAAIGLPFAAHAATDSYSASRMHYNIYGSGSYATMPPCHLSCLQLFQGMEQL